MKANYYTLVNDTINKYTQELFEKYWDGSVPVSIKCYDRLFIKNGLKPVISKKQWLAFPNSNLNMGDRNYTDFCITQLYFAIIKDIQNNYSSLEFITRYDEFIEDRSANSRSFYLIDEILHIAREVSKNLMIPPAYVSGMRILGMEDAVIANKLKTYACNLS